MGRHGTKFPILAVFAILAVTAMMVLNGRDNSPAQPQDMGGSTETANLPPNDLRYFHPLPGKSSATLNPADASIQVKGVAANRHVSPQEVRKLMEEHTEGRGQEPQGRQRINVEELNQALDEHWPIK